MPENALRGYHLRQHWVRSSTGRAPALYKALRLHGDWPLCPSGCGWPVDPVVGNVHPGCERKEIEA